MASIGEQVTAAVAAALGGAGKPAGFTVERDRREEIERDSLPLAAVYTGSDHFVRYVGSNYEDRRRIIRVEVRAEGSPSDQALDPYVGWVRRSLLADRTLGGLARDLGIGDVEYDAEIAEVVLGGASVEVWVEYRQLRDNPEAQ